MASRTAKNKRKGINGSGDSVTVFFDISDPAERKALSAAKLLAAKHGRRKQAIIALLEAVYDHYEASGELLTTAEITGALLGQAPIQAHAPVGFALPTGQIVASDMTAEKRRAGRQYADDSPGVVITGGGKADARTVADNFLKAHGADFFG